MKTFHLPTLVLKIHSSNSVMMQPDAFSGGYIPRRFFTDDVDGGVGGFYGYRFSGDAPNFDGGLLNLDSYCGSAASSSSLDLRRRFEAASSDLLTESLPADEKTLAALRNHKEAEKRRRERINSHLDRLRSILPCSSKTDKATLLAKVVQRVRELNQETSEIMKLSGLVVPSERDEFSVDAADDENENTGSEMILRASLCCEDRSDLFSELTEVVNSLNLKTVRAEMSTLGGRARNVLIVSGERCRGEEYVAFLHDALKGIVQRSGSGDRLKRRRRMDPQLA